MSYAFYKGFDEILEGTSVLIKTDTDEDIFADDQVKTNSNFKKLNRYAYAILMKVVKDEIGFNAINNAQTEDLSKGDAYQVWLPFINQKVVPRNMN